MNKDANTFFWYAAILVAVVVVGNMLVPMGTVLNVVAICMATVCATLGCVCLIVAEVVEQQKADKEDKEGPNKNDKEGFEIISL